MNQENLWFPLKVQNRPITSQHAVLRQKHHRKCIKKQTLDSTSQNSMKKASLSYHRGLESQWNEQKSTLVYNFQDGTLNPTRLRASDYKYNRQTTLPKAEEAEV